MFIPRILTLIDGAGGLFDFNATLPLMAIQFILLSVVLTFVFYKPIAKIVDDRNLYIKENFEAAYEKLAKADELNKEYDEKLRVANVSARAFIAESDKATKALIASEIGEVGKRAIRNIQTANQDAENKRDIVLSKLSIDYGLSQAESLTNLLTALTSKKKSNLHTNRWLGVLLRIEKSEYVSEEIPPYFTDLKSYRCISSKFAFSELDELLLVTKTKILDSFFSVPRKIEGFKSFLLC
jgi:F-type H+-transporting ATPase subunit b